MMYVGIIIQFNIAILTVDIVWKVYRNPDIDFNV